MSELGILTTWGRNGAVYFHRNGFVMAKIENIFWYATRAHIFPLVKVHHTWNGFRVEDFMLMVNASIDSRVVGTIGTYGASNGTTKNSHANKFSKEGGWHLGESLKEMVSNSSRGKALMKRTGVKSVSLATWKVWLGRDRESSYLYNFPTHLLKLKTNSSSS